MKGDKTKSIPDMTSTATIIFLYMPHSPFFKKAPDRFNDQVLQ
ncbi:hypothetical protein CHCC20441_0225 [Bacillus licheniformis]|uniref:Uncharacterized protein n=1 Tax=Bacillus licheniformis TaxID=1402 RepID=A0A8B5YCN2_BACLI|nr:hypothetical protein B4092_0393 [Bacillus licheniformis]TWN08625.1 hypothetical protein CHCC14564_2357 [Bacillus licheniformis LMG 17339]KYC77452.1 hypothetical protein B4090_0669 [Bacillus licheniformis]KYC79632.1 hypothetical protein B4091_0605 [Bacillus licheniformis]KYC94179.1 hypothetical protein B4164_0522 [Bacillus licheniformis]